MHISRPRISFSYGRDITLDHHEILRSFVYRAIDDSLARLTFHQRLSMSISTPRMRTHTHTYIYIRSRAWVSTGRELSLYFSTVSHRSFPRANRKWNEIENWPNHFNVDRDENGKGRNTSRYSIADDYDCTINIENIYSLQFITDYRTVHFVVFFRVEWFHTVKRRTYSFNVYTRSS